MGISKLLIDDYFQGHIKQLLYKKKLKKRAFGTLSLQT